MTTTTPPDHLAADRTAILEAALPQVPFDGWTVETLYAAAAEAGIDEARATLCFPGGMADFVCFFVSWADQRMIAQLDALDVKAMKIRDRIRVAVRTRLEDMEPHKEAVRRGVAILSYPPNATRAAASLYGTVDAIWRAAGDTSTDYNFYTKRATLAALYSAVLLRWLGDTSEGHADTWAFLDRRIENVMSFEKWKAKLPDLKPALEAPFRILGALRYPGGAGRSRD